MIQKAKKNKMILSFLDLQNLSFDLDLQMTLNFKIDNWNKFTAFQNQWIHILYFYFCEWLVAIRDKPFYILYSLYRTTLWPPS